jgi:tetratricopeptide (TPR) repeat protein
MKSNYLNKYYSLKSCLIAKIAFLLVFALFLHGKYVFAQNTMDLQKNETTPSVAPYKPDESIVLSILSNYINSKQYKQAAEYSDKAISYYPYSSNVFSLIAKLKLENFDYYNAELLAKQSVSLNPKNSNAYLVLGDIYLETAENYKDFKDITSYLKLANQNYKLSLKYNFKLASAYIGIARVCKDKDDYSEMFNYLNLANSFNKVNPVVYYYYADYYYHCGDFESAIKNLQTAINYSEQPNYKLHLLLAQSYEKISATNLAYEQYKKVLEINPKDTLAKKKLDLIKNCIN